MKVRDIRILKMLHETELTRKERRFLNHKAKVLTYSEVMNNRSNAYDLENA